MMPGIGLSSTISIQIGQLHFFSQIMVHNLFSMPGSLCLVGLDHTLILLIRVFGNFQWNVFWLFGALPGFGSSFYLFCSLFPWHFYRDGIIRYRLAILSLAGLFLLFLIIGISLKGENHYSDQYGNNLLHPLKIQKIIVFSKIL